MILDVARHKFADGVATLLLCTLTLIVFVAVGVDGGATEVASYSPLMSLLANATFGIPFVEKSLVVILYITSVLSLSRATLRTHIYPADTMAAMALTAVMMLPMVVGPYALHQAVIMLLSAFALGNMLFCFGPRKSTHRLFGAMIAAGLLPVVEASLMVVPIAMAITHIAARKRLREAIVVVTGILLPLFATFYIAWLSGEGFTESALTWWRSATAPIASNMLDTMPIPRLCFFALALFLQLVAAIMHYAQRDTHTATSRGAWRAMQFTLLVVALALIFMPSASDSLLSIGVILTAAMLPTLFVCSEAIVSTLAYVALIGLAFAAAF
jgi:hypothetical protein